jgi:hypothetical protein
MCSNVGIDQPTEIHMYIGGSLLGALLVIAVIVFLLRRA